MALIENIIDFIILFYFVLFLRGCDEKEGEYVSLE
jgi:hypothetical protein